MRFKKLRYNVKIKVPVLRKYAVCHVVPSAL